jgi:hypothetical protein
MSEEGRANAEAVGPDQVDPGEVGYGHGAGRGGGDGRKPGPWL